MNWGKGIAMGMGLFIIFIIVLVVGLMRNRVDLESEDYYQKEIDYESEIQAMKNVNELDDKITVTQTEDYIVVKLAEDLEYKNVELRFKRPDDNKLDKSYSVKHTRNFLIDKKELKSGKFNLEISYQINDKSYLQKENLFVE